MPDAPEAPPEARLLRRKRIARGLSPAQAAELTGVSGSTYRQVENGYHIPARGLKVPKIAPPETLAKMLHAFGATPRELIKAGRADAAEILEGIILEEAAVTQAAERPADDRERIEAAVTLLAAKGNTDPSGDELFGKDTWESGSWDAFGLDGHPVSERIMLIAQIRAKRAGSAGRAAGSA
jgi:transcriptional regulator with XRE-family HTH domain